MPNVPWETWVSAAICGVLILGVLVNRITLLHVPLMLTAFAADLGLVLWLEFGRSPLGEGAVEKAFAGVSGLRYFHITMAVIAVVMYFLLIPSGWKLLNNRSDAARRARHKRLAMVFGASRGLVLITSFFL